MNLSSMPIRTRIRNYSGTRQDVINVAAKLNLSRNLVRFPGRLTLEEVLRIRENLHGPEEEHVLVQMLTDTTRKAYEVHRALSGLGPVTRKLKAVWSAEY